MVDRALSTAEKTKLTDFAREVVARNSRTSSKQVAEPEGMDPVDVFSQDGLQRRIVTLERDFAALDRRVEKSLAAILTVLERLEARAARTSGELRAVQDELDAQAGNSAYVRDELKAAAKEYGALLNGELAQLVDRLDSAKTTEAFPAPSSKTARDG